MAVDSIIARPTNRVRVMVAEASGCCASEVSAVATGAPFAQRGSMQPMAVVRPAVTIEATAMMVMLSIVVSFGYCVVVVLSVGAGSGLGLRVRVAAAI